MKDKLINIASPEEEELNAKRASLSALSDLLAEKELELQELKSSVDSFQHLYINQVGYKYVELDLLSAQIAEARSIWDPKDKQAKFEAEHARKKAEETTAEFEGFVLIKDIKKEKSYVSDEMKKLYRKIASIIHPDKATDEKSRNLRTKLMSELNQAYTQEDLERMNEILLEWESSPDTVTGEGTAADLVRVIRATAQVRRRIGEVEKQITSIKNSEICRLMIEVQKAEMEGRKLLDEMSAAVQCRIEEAKQQLARLNQDIYEKRKY